jgi:DnaD/phage-associated family protein
MAENISYAFKDKASLSSLFATEAFIEASPEDLRVLVALLISDCITTRAQLEADAGCDSQTLTGALQYWRGAGVLTKVKKQPKEQNEQAPQNEQPELKSTESAAKDDQNETKTKKRPVASLDKFAETPSDVLARHIDKQKLATLIEACQQITGKTLSSSEVNIIVGMRRELSLDGDYILTLISYCYENERRSLKYVEKMAFVLTEQGICTEEDLVQYIDERKRFATLEWQLKRKFGMGNRDFTKTQAALVRKWEKDYAFPLEVITLAYDITVDTINKLEFKYMDKILTRWYENGCKTEADALAFIEKEKLTRTPAEEQQKPKKSTVGVSSFDTDDFFNRALERSYKK